MNDKTDMMAEELANSLQEQCASEKKEIEDSWKQKLSEEKEDQLESLTKEHERAVEKVTNKLTRSC